MPERASTIPSSIDEANASDAAQGRDARRGKPTVSVLTRLLPPGSFLRHVALLGSGNALGQIILFGSTIILAKLYSKEALGDWQVFVNTAAAFLPLVNLRYELAVMLPKEDEEAVHVILLATLVACFMSTGSLVFLWWGPTSTSLARAADQLGGSLWLLAPYLLTLGLFQVCSYWITRRQQFRRMGTSVVWRSLVTAVVQVALGWFFHATFFDLILGTLLGQAAATIYLLADVIRRDRALIWRHGDWRQLLPTAIRFRNFPLYSVPYGFVTVLAVTVLIWLIKINGTDHDAGLYSYAFRLTYAPIGFVGTALKQAFFRRATAAENIATLEPFVSRSVMGIILITTAPTILFMLNAGDVFAWLYGETWRGAGDYAFWLTLPAMALFLTTWLDRIYDALRLNLLALTMEVIHNLVNVAAVFACFHWYQNPLLGVAVFAIISTIYNLIWLAVTYRVANFRPRMIAATFATLGATIAACVAIHQQLMATCPRPIGIAIYIVLMLIAYLYIAAKYLQQRRAAAIPAKGI